MSTYHPGVFDATSAEATPVPVVTGNVVADRILAAVQKRQRMTRTDISGLFARRLAAESLRSALTSLVDAGRLRAVREIGPGGRAMTVFEIAA